MSDLAAIDLGTTTARVGIFAADGEPRGIARTRLTTRHPFPGAVEQDPDEFVGTTRDLLGQALAAAGRAVTDLAGLAITTQRATVIAWDAETGRPLGPALGWQDTRTAARVAEFVAQGIPLTTSASCSKLEWMTTHIDAVRDAAGRGTLRLGTVDTWLGHALSGGAAHVTDPSSAGATGCFDLRTGDWSDGALALFGVPRAPLADVVASDAVVAVTDGDLVGAEVPLAARLGDQQAAAAAHGLTAGAAKLTLGTSAMLDLATGPAPGDPPAGSYALPLWRRTLAGTVVDEFMIESSIQTAGAVVEWLVRMGLLESIDQVDPMARRGSGEVAFAPVLAGLGSPWQDPNARGVVTGLGLDSTPADVVAAALTGIAHRVADLTEGLGLSGELRVDGGLSRSRVLLQAIADLTGLRLLPAAEPETTLRGAAVVAASGPALGSDPLPPVAYGTPVEPSIAEPERRSRRDQWATLIDATSAAIDSSVQSS